MNSIFETEQYKNAELKTYTSITALCSATGLDKRIVKLAKKSNLEGFNSNQTVNWSKLRPVLELEYDNLLSAGDNDISYWKREIAKKDSRLKELQIKKLEKNLIEPEQVKQFMVEFATIQSTMLKKIFNEMPPKLIGLDEPAIKNILDRELQEVFNILSKKIDKLE